MFSNTKPSSLAANRDLTVKNRPALSGAGNATSTCFAISWSGIFLLLIVTMGILVLPANAYTTPEGILSSQKVYVSGVTYDPGVFFVGDTGTVTFAVTNSNSDQSVVVNHATFSDAGIDLISGTYDASANLGPLQTRSFVFSVAATAPEGTYYPTFSLNFRDGDSLWYRSMVKIDNTPLVLTILDKPDTFTEGRKKSINLQISNPRDNEVQNVILDASGAGATVSPAKIFIGDIASGANKSATFAVTPDQLATLLITVNYYNGDNLHKVTMELPIEFGTDKKQASPVISNVLVKSEAGTYHITGDVTNAGLETANAVTVTSTAPAVPADPYRSYIVGALKPDDFGSFEVTFTAANATSVPLQLSFKDSDGNVVTSRLDVAVTIADAAQNQVLPNLLPVMVIVIVLALAGGYLYIRRRKNQ
ncbi:MAG: hypothetical protein NTZ39_06690 [Methanoregula sp.]|nr:hypothetical protein [Methanoregula sp.]